MNITFKKFTENDLSIFLDWAKKPHVKEIWFRDGYDSLDKYKKQIQGNGYDYCFIICVNDEPIGYIQTSDLYAYRTLCENPKGLFIHEEPGTFCLDLFIGEEKYLNKGYGTEIVKAFVQKLLAEFKAKKIVLDPACSNRRAIRCYEKDGFVVVKKEHDGVDECYGMEFVHNLIEVRNWSDKLEKQALELLNNYEETSLFLLSNLKTYGTVLTEDSYSADFKCLVKNAKVVAVFALTKIGNLLVQTDRAQDYANIIIGECLKSSIPLKGIVADWIVAKPMWDYAKNHMSQLKETAQQKEILFKLSLENIAIENITKKEAKFNIRYLNAADYQEWNLLNNLFLKERELSQSEEEKLKYKRFLKDVERRYLLGLFIDEKLTSMAAFTAHVNNTGLIGGVYTISDKRKLGLAKDLIYQLLLDGRMNKHLEKIILFTGEDNVAAIKLYESLGFKRIGSFALLFGEYDKHSFELSAGDLEARAALYRDKTQEQNALDWALQYLSLGIGKSATAGATAAAKFEYKKIADTSYSSVYKIQTLTNARYSYYLKQTPEALFTEPQILNFLAQHGCKNIPAVVAINNDLCCFLMMACGDISLRKYFNGNIELEMLRQGIANYTSIQRSMEKYTAELLELGVPDWRLDQFPTLYDQLIQQEQLLLDDGLSKTEIVRLQRLSSACRRLANELAEYKIPETIGHCDFHENNMLLDQKTSAINIIDWGETVITHPFFSLQMCLWNITHFYNVKPTDPTYHKLQTQCVAPWLGLCAETKLLQALDIAAKLNGIYAALGFARLYAATNNQLRLEHNGAIAGCLRSFLQMVGYEI
jgi:RimJ/RimL family protein N-acetyltransferase